ncbi:MAG: STAS/SEC14 domain-containing protein [Rhodanobacteraceae bacterium]
MLTCKQIAGTNILEITLDGAMDGAAFDQVAATIERMIAEHGKIRILEVVRNIGAIEPAALWRDLKFSPAHLKDFSHAAIVTDKKWIEWMTALVSPFIPAEVRFFEMAQLDEARAWLRDAPRATR